MDELDINSFILLNTSSLETGFLYIRLCVFVIHLVAREKLMHRIMDDCLFFSSFLQYRSQYPLPNAYNDHGILC